MKKILLVILLGVVLTMYGQEDPYSKDPERKAIKFAYELLKVYYPSNQLCVSDTIYNFDWIPALRVAPDSLQQDIFENKYLKQGHHTPVHLKSLTSMFDPDTCRCNRYVADFSEPYKGFILCEILPRDRQIGILGEPEISVFVFQYNEEGEIWYVSKTIRHVD